MKNLLIILAAIVILTGCSKQEKTQDDPIDKWNGYSHLKGSSFTQPLLAGRHIDVGTVTYGINDADAYFYAIYDCSASGWLISETHMYAGLKSDMPLNKKKANPKIGRFPFKGNHSNESVVTYTIPLADLPTYDDPGFVVSTHAVVNNPDGGNETAWGEGNYPFTDKGWGWYEKYYELAENDFTILYGTQFANDSLYLYHINITTGTSDLVLTELVGNTNATFDGTAYDEESGNFFFTNYETGELMINPLLEDSDSYSAGTLDGIAASATYYDGSFYYVDETVNTLKEVTFDSEWNIATETAVSVISNNVVVTDIAMDPSGESIYIMGDADDGTSELITYSIATDSFSTIELAVGSNTSIAYSTDGILYGVTSADDSGSGFGIFSIDLSNGSVTNIVQEDDDEIIIDDPIDDLSRGPIM